MIITKTKLYNKSYKSKIVDKHLFKEINRIQAIEDLFFSKSNLYEVLHDPLSKIYRVEKKTGNLREYYTARVNSKIRLKIKPVGEYPYNIMEISDVIFEDIDDSHYGEG